MEMKEAAVTEELEAFARQRRAGPFGVADPALAHDFIASQSDTQVSQFPWAIFTGMQLCGSSCPLGNRQVREGKEKYG